MCGRMARHLVWLWLVAPGLILGGCAGHNHVSAPPALDAPLLPLAIPGDLAGAEKATVADLLRADVKALSQQIGNRSVASYANLTRAADYIAGQLQAAGYTVTRQTFTAGGKSVCNLAANKAGASATAPLVVVGAHYDTDRNPGADDNASGVAMVLELARLLAGQRPACRVRFVAFVNEEDPWNQTDKMGSVVCAKALKRAGENVRGALCFDMVGWYSSSRRYFMVGGNRSSQTLTDRCATLFAGGTTMTLSRIPTNNPDLPYCDTWAFWQQGYSSVLFSSPGYYYDPNYHEATDTWDKLSYVDMARAITGLVAVVKQL